MKLIPFGRRWSSLLIVAMSVTQGAGALSAAPQIVDTPAMKIIVEDGYLTQWTNKRSGDAVDFGEGDYDGHTVKGQPYAPGVWWADATRDKDFASSRVEWSTQVERLDDDAVLLRQKASSTDTDLHAVQWGLRVPLASVKAVHYPHGVALPAVATKDDLEWAFVKKNYYFRGRPGALSFHGWRNRFYIIETEHGGLLIHVDDPKFDHRPALEFDAHDGYLFISNRSIMNPPWTRDYEGCSWIVRQFDGALGRGGQLFQDYLVKAQDIKPLKDRPTAWVQNLAYTMTKPGTETPLSYPDKPDVFNYRRDWKQSIDFRVNWLKEVAKVFNPDQVMFYTTGWNYGGLDVDYPDHSVDPIYAYTSGQARRMGFHAMIHLNSKFFMEPSLGVERYLIQPWRVEGDAADKPGVVFDALQNHLHEVDHEPNNFQLSLGIDHKMIRYTFNPAYEPFRYVFAAMVLSSVRATGADMLHFDVPSIPLELHNDRYGMNIAQGLGELFKLIRETLDENGFDYVAIATEITPSEPIMKYVDMGQNARDYNALGLLKGTPQAELKELQLGEALTREREITAKAQEKPKGFDVDGFRQQLGELGALGEPSVDAMLRAGYVVGYPHLGILGPGNPQVSRRGEGGGVHELVAQTLALWTSIIAQVLPHDQLQYPVFMDKAGMTEGPWLEHEREAMRRTFHREEARTLTSFNYGKFALVRFWEAFTPRPASPGTWRSGELARFELKDGRHLIATRTAPTVMHLALDDGTVVADLDLFNGWRNADWLVDHYAPTAIKEQVDPIDLSADQVGTLVR